MLLIRIGVLCLRSIAKKNNTKRSSILERNEIDIDPLEICFKTEEVG